MLRAATQPQIRLGGNTWLSTIAPWGEPVITWGIHGPYELTWSMTLPTKAWRHPLLRSRRRVEVILGARCIWGGRINDANFQDGTFSAEGYHREAEGAEALNAAGRPTTLVNTAVDEAIARGVISWRRSDDWPVGIGFVGPLDGDASNDDPQLVKLDALLDSASAEEGGEWVVDAKRRLFLRTENDATTWVVPTGVAAMGTATDDRIDRVLISYRDSGDGDRRRTVGYPATTPVGGVEESADVSRKITMTAAKATSYAEEIYRRVNGGKDGWTNGVGVGPGQLLTPGGQYAHPSHVRGNDNVRLLGIPDPRDGVTGDTTFRIETVAWDVANRSLQLNPVGLADRSFEAIARRVLPKPKKERSVRAHLEGPYT